MLSLVSASTTRKLMSLGTYVVGNKTVTMISLLFIRVISFTINVSTVSSRERKPHRWAWILRVVSFHKFLRKILFNKINMELKMVAKILLVIRRDVQTPW